MQTHVTSWGHINRLSAVAATFACLVVWQGLFTGPSAVRAQQADAQRPVLDPVVHVTEADSDLQMIEKFARVVELKNRITTVYGFDPQVISVTKVERRPNQIRLHAVAPGVTSVVLVDEHDQSFKLEVFVTGDVRHLQATIRKLFPKSSVEVVALPSSTDASVLLRGWVTQPEHINEVVEIAEQFYPNVINQMQIGGVQQVLLKVKVMEVQRAKIRKLGFNFLHLDNDNFVASTPGQLTPVGGLGDSGIQPATIAASLADPSVLFGIVSDDELFQGFVEALKEESLLKILAEPELVTTNGRPANLLAGGEFPILVPQSLGTVTIEWREFGVRLEAVPIMLGNGRVRLELQPEVSERDFTNAVQVSGLTVPGLTTRRVNTQVEMNFGQTFIIAGLLSTEQTAETSKIPFLGELPWIGAAFRRVSYDHGETELIIMVTPELVGPLSPDQVPPGGPGLFTDTPTDRELFRDGMLEVPSYGDRCEGCGIPGPSVMQSYDSPTPHSALPEGEGAGMMETAPSSGQTDTETLHIMPSASGTGSLSPMFPHRIQAGSKAQLEPSVPHRSTTKTVVPGNARQESGSAPLSASPPLQGEDEGAAATNPSWTRSQTHLFRPSGTGPAVRSSNAPAPHSPHSVSRGVEPPGSQGAKRGAQDIEADAFQPPRLRKPDPNTFEHRLREALRALRPSKPGLIEPKSGLIAPSDDATE